MRDSHLHTSRRRQARLRLEQLEQRTSATALLFALPVPAAFDLLWDGPDFESNRPATGLPDDGDHDPEIGPVVPPDGSAPDAQEEAVQIRAQSFARCHVATKHPARFASGPNDTRQIGDPHVPQSAICNPQPLSVFRFDFRAADHSERVVDYPGAQSYASAQQPASPPPVTQYDSPGTLPPRGHGPRQVHESAEQTALDEALWQFMATPGEEMFEVSDFSGLMAFMGNKTVENGEFATENW